MACGIGMRQRHMATACANGTRQRHAASAYGIRQRHTATAYGNGNGMRQWHAPTAYCTAYGATETKNNGLPQSNLHKSTGSSTRIIHVPSFNVTLLIDDPPAESSALRCEGLDDFEVPENGLRR